MADSIQRQKEERRAERKRKVNKVNKVNCHYSRETRTATLHNRNERRVSQTRGEGNNAKEGRRLME
jgi:hypothetical protein